MAVSLAELREQTLYRLGDPETAVWSGAEIDAHIRRGYDELCRLTRLLWDWEILAAASPSAGSHTATWEVEWLEAIHDRFNHTAEWESSYVAGESPAGPADHTTPWEYTEGYADGYIPTTIELPERLLELERATWDSELLEPVLSVEAERLDSRYKIARGSRPLAWVWDQDGIRRIRLYPIPDSSSGLVDVDGTWGGPRDGLDDEYAMDVEDEWGVPRTVPPALKAEGSRGIPRNWDGTSGVLKVEFYKRGADLVADGDTFDIPGHSVRYVRHFAQARALERDGPGQDMALAKHYDARFLEGVERIKRRRRRLESQRQRVLGGPATTKSRIPTPRLPWNYGRMAR